MPVDSGLTTNYHALAAVSAGGPVDDPGFDPKEVAAHGLGVITAAVFLAGEMAGSGVLALPAAMIGTGWPGLVLIVLFTVNACYSGTRLGWCWVILGTCSSTR